MAACALRELGPMTVASITMRAPFFKIPKAFSTVYGWLQKQGHRPQGMPLAVYLEDPATAPPERALWEIWAPIEEEAESYGPDEQGLAIKRVPVMTVATTVHQGPYDQVGPAYERLTAWIAENGVELAGPPMEAYLNDPGEASPEEYLTEILFPVIQIS